MWSKNALLAFEPREVRRSRPEPIMEPAPRMPVALSNRSQAAAPAAPNLIVLPSGGLRQCQAPLTHGEALLSTGDFLARDSMAESIWRGEMEASPGLIARSIGLRDAPTPVPRILVIDDERSILNLIAQILEQEGFEVRTAESGHRALDLIQCEPGISLTILDWRLPGMSGEKVLDQLVAVRPSIKVIVASGDQPLEVERAFAGRRVDGFLWKPFNIHALVTAVKFALTV